MAVCLGLSAAAAETRRGDVDLSVVVEGEVGRSEVGEIGRRAFELELTEADWTRYEELMRGRRGLWTPDADPLLVLGAHARNEAERRRYAEAFVMAEFERVEGELAFERAVQEAWGRLFPGEPRLVMAAARVVDRYAVVLDRECAQCGRTVRRYAAGTVPVDVYVRGAVDDGDLRAWVAEQGLDVEAIRGGQLTVNHDRGQGAVGPVPVVMGRGEDGRWEASR